MIMRLLICLLYCTSLYSQDLTPVAYKGRIRPLSVYAEQWLYQLSQDYSFSKNPFALELLLSIHAEGTEKWNETPLFAIANKELQKTLQLDSKSSRYSYNELKKHLNKALYERIISYAFFNSPLPSDKRELTEIAPGLLVAKYGEKLVVLAAPETLPVKQGWTSPAIFNTKDKRFYEAARDLLQQLAYWEMLGRDASSLLIMIPGRWVGAPWQPFKGKFTHEAAEKLLSNYKQIAGTPAQHAQGKALYYPTMSQLKAEAFYHAYPWVLVCIVAYGLALLLFRKPVAAYCVLGAGFLCHTGLILVRSYILNRPPVSNMYESVLFVPWAALFFGMALGCWRQSKSVIFSSALLAFILLVIVYVTHMDASLENVQPVLDSQFWLIIHVLMVVSSYAVFLLAGILAHLYLLRFMQHRHETHSMKKLANHHVQLLYLGTALLIPGTILGGVWAAESWGRFWDWDPKESWAFISSCIYVLFIHAFRFRYIHHFGLAMGSIAGLQAITFTWYGVNYILGTGLHSYGFGKGGEWLYFSLVVGELIFMAIVAFICSSLRNLLNQNIKLEYHND